MKTKFIHVGKRTLSVVLSIMMIVSTMLIGTITSVSALTYSEPIFYLIGSFTGNNWDSKQTSYKIENSYQNTTGKFYIEVDVPTGTSNSSPAYFALYKTDGSSARYAPATQHTKVGSTGVQGDYNHSGNSWTYTGSASKIRICVDQRSDESDFRYYPYIWIEEVAPIASTSYYITGRFKVKNTSGNETSINWDWTSKNIPFTDVGDGLYKLETNYTLSDLSANISSATPYFAVYDGTKWYSSPEANMETHKTSVNALSLNTYTSAFTNADNTMYFTDTSKNGNVILWLDTASGMKLYYTLDGETPTSHSVTYDVHSSGGGTLSATSGDSGSTVTSGSSVTFTATPADNYKVEGWYSNEACTSAISGASGSEYTVENVTSDLTVYVKFTLSSTPTPTGYYYQNYVLSNNIMGASGDRVELTQDSSGEYAYTKINAPTNDHFFLISDSSTTYYHNGDIYKNKLEGSNISEEAYINIGEYNANDSGNVNRKFAKTSKSGDIYIIVFYPDTTINATSSPIVVASTLLPGETPPPPPAPTTYKVTMNQGVSSKVNGAMGSSYLDGVATNISVDKSFDNLTVTFTTETKLVTSTGDASLNYTGYMYQVYGYSVLMTLQDGTTQVDAVVNPINDKNSVGPISPLGKGVYQCDYTFPSNITSAVVTPVFTVSDDYATKRNISFTALYLKVTPGKNVFSNTYEPRYYTWRDAATDTTSGAPFVVQKNGRYLEREPEGSYGGQIMLHTNDDMYIAYVQSDIYGILFDDGGNVQSFDFNEFIKLQKLGYNNITFEPKIGNGNTVSTGINGRIGTDVDNFYNTYTNGPEVDIDEYVDSDFELDVDIEGYYIDVFGNRLTNTAGDEIKRATILNGTTMTTSQELTALMNAISAKNKIYGARYGWYTTQITNYGMEYAIRNYYIDGTSKKIVSQQVSGYGTIEGAQSPEDPAKNNAAYMYAKDSTNHLTYYNGSENTSNTFTTGYELISDTYKNLPYLVSYKNATTVRATSADVQQENYTRIDGKWYYMASVPQITVTAKVGLMNADGTINMTDGIINDYTGNLKGCSATVNLEPYATIDQGSSAILRAYTAGGYVFAGFYEENGRFISASNPYEKVFANHSNVYAVFKTIESGTLTVTNNIYNSILSNPAPGGGSGSISVQLIVQHKNDDGSYSEAEKVSGTNSASVAIKDGDIFQWKITGKATGADEFIAFRQLSTLVDGSSYYVALDDEVCLSCDKTTNTYTYTSYECEWNWFNQTGTSQEGSLFKTFDFYTDFQKVSSFATLNYKYVNRFDEVKIYTVKNVPLDYDQVQQNNYKPTDTMILQYAPPIDEVFKDCTWKITDVTLLDRSNSVATLEAIQDRKKYITYIKNGSNPIPKHQEAYFNDPIQLTADEKNGEQSFSYWKRYLTDTNGKITGDGEIFSYQRSISVRVTFNSYFEAVYGAADEKYYTNLQDPVYTREKFTDTNGNTTDYVYADFLLQFDSSDPNKTFADIVKNSGGSVKFGIVLERDTKYSYDGKGDIIAPGTYESDLENTILSLGKGLSAGGTAKGWNTDTTTTDPQYNYYYNLYDLTDKADALSTLGRYDLIFRYNNDERNRSRVYNAYTYIIYTDESGDHIVVSKPKVLSIYETGIKADGSTSSTTTA